MKDEMSGYRKRIVGGMIIYGIFSLGIIPVFTLIMGARDNVLTVSMSAIDVYKRQVPHALCAATMPLRTALVASAIYAGARRALLYLSLIHI